MSQPPFDAFPVPPDPSNSNTVGMRTPMRMPQNTNSTTLPGSSAVGGFGAIPAGGLAGAADGGGFTESAMGMSGTPGGGVVGGIPGGLRGISSGGQPTSVINLANSSDVVIGPMTQYQGSVTIYQYMDATFDTSISGKRGPVRSEAARPGNLPEVPKRCGIFNITTRQKLTILILCINILALCVGLYFGLKYIGSTDRYDSDLRPPPLPRDYRPQYPPETNGTL